MGSDILAPPLCSDVEHGGVERGRGRHAPGHIQAPNHIADRSIRPGKVPYIARHVIDPHFEPSFIELDGILDVARPSICGALGPYLGVQRVDHALGVAAADADVHQVVGAMRQGPPDAGLETSGGRRLSQ